MGGVCACVCVYEETARDLCVCVCGTILSVPVHMLSHCVCMCECVHVCVMGNKQLSISINRVHGLPGGSGSPITGRDVRCMHRKPVLSSFIKTGV